MLGIRLICVGKIKEKFYKEAVGEYEKRLAGFCKFEIVELSEEATADGAGGALIDVALTKEALSIEKRIVPGAALVAMCAEGTALTSSQFSDYLKKCAGSGVSRICFVIGGSIGLHQRIKDKADLRLSMSKMTFPHHLARVILAEQIYRGFMIAVSGKYHK